MLARVVFVALALSAASASLTCLDESGNSVDWFVAMKRPDGYAYSYGDVNNQNFVTSSNSLQDKTGAIARTLSQPNLFSGSQTFAKYNDQPPNKSPYEPDGHTKGVLAIDPAASSGFWLIHSVPNWPSTGAYDGFPESESDYGQSFLCVSITDPTSFENIGAAWLLDRPEFYETYVSTEVRTKFPALADVIENHTHYDAAATNVSEIRSAAGHPFTLFSKNSAWNNDLYNHLVSPHFDADTYVESWENGRGQMQNFCTPTYAYNTYNIQSYTIAGFEMGETKDHSKWCVFEGHYYLCIGGINRQTSQYKRGGGTMCFSSRGLTTQLKSQMVTWSVPPRGGCAPAPSA